MGGIIFEFAFEVVGIYEGKRLNRLLLLLFSNFYKYVYNS